jgi:hypothetical protein
MAVIELGESRGEVRRDLLSPVARPAARWWRGAAVLALLLGTVAAATPVPRPLPEATITAQTGAELVLAGGRLLVTEPAQDSAHEAPGLSAYRLPDAAPLWRVTLSRPLQGPVQLVTATGDTVLVTGNPLGDAPPRSETVALSAATGAELWRLDGQFAGLTVTGDVLLSTGLAYGPDDGQPVSLRLVDAATGTDRWSYRIAPGVAWSLAGPDGRVTALVVRLPSGRVERRAIDTGAVVQAADLPRPGGNAPQAWRYPEVVGDLLLLPDQRGALTAYGLDRLDPRWTVDGQLDADAGVWDCETVLCVSARQGGIRALDRQTGRTLWNVPDWHLRWLADGFLIVSPEIARSADGGRLATLDLASGRILGDLTGWDLLQSSHDHTRLLGVRYGPDGAWLAELDQATGSARTISLLRDVSRNCQAGSRVIVCRRYDGSIGVWRLPG